MDIGPLVSSLHRSLDALAARPALPLTASILLAAYVAARYFSSPWRHLPPGPPGYPIIGSALEIFSDKQRFFEKCTAYGEVVYVNLAGQPAIIFNSLRTAADILDRRAATFSSRPRAIVTNELLSNHLNFIIEGHTDNWRRQRRAVNEGFRPTAATRYYAMEAEEAARLALALAGDANISVPGGYAHHYNRYSASISFMINFDRAMRDSPEDRAMATTLDDIGGQLQRTAAPGAHFVEFFPAMLMIPARFAKWKRDALEGHVRITKFYNTLIDDVKKRMAIGEARPCLARTLIEEKEHFGLSEAETSWAAGMMYVVGSETQGATLEWATLALAAHPEVQRRAHAELDAAIGHARAPRVDDRAQMPYIAAIIREVLRWRPVVPSAVPHMAEEDTWYEGMFIPKGSLCLPNIVACNMDPQLYGADAARFNPARFLDEKGQLKPSLADTKDEGHVTYGFGRRICVGRHVANDTLFVAVATMLWAFELSTVGEYDLDTYVDKGISSCPKPFKCKFVPRFPDATAILAGTLETS
ncbi:cytochrome P450 [Vararia minispora EC-137]|uniref:Cytochrome P450 n=1 Tax=Vararia minispora EC-137 TaxID=1314806 RepID=A0ACB8Q798_9AGAM|nr:cytochrome P450 [Vararia minispora EC-137]